MLKGNIWSRVGGLSPLRKNCSLFPLTLREVKWKVSQQLQDPALQSLGPLGVFWSSHTSPCCGWRPVTRRALVLGQNLWSGLWYVTVSDGGIHIAFSLPDTQETSKTEKKGDHQWIFSTRIWAWNQNEQTIIAAQTCYTSLVSTFTC